MSLSRCPRFSNPLSKIEGNFPLKECCIRRFWRIDAIARESPDERIFHVWYPRMIRKGLKSCPYVGTSFGYYNYHSRCNISHTPTMDPLIRPEEGASTITNFSYYCGTAIEKKAWTFLWIWSWNTSHGRAGSLLCSHNHLILNARQRFWILELGTSIFCIKKLHFFCPSDPFVVRLWFTDTSDHLLFQGRRARTKITRSSTAGRMRSSNGSVATPYSPYSTTANPNRASIPNGVTDGGGGARGDYSNHAP